MRNSRRRKSRRSFLQYGLAGLTLPAFLRQASSAALLADSPSPARADAVLFINLAGGPSHLDSLDMKPEAPAETRGEFKSIPTKIAGLHICELMPEIAKRMDRCALIRGIHHSAGAHPQGQSYISTGNRPSPAVVYPSLGSIVGKEMPGRPDLPPYIAIPQTEWNAGYMGDGFAPFKTNAVPRPGQPFSVRGVTLAQGLTAEKVERREQLLNKLDRRFEPLADNSPLVDALDTFGKQAYQMITSKRTREAFDVSREPDSIQKLFGKDELAQSLLLATRLLSFGTRFVTVTNPGWDTHLDNFKGHRRLLPPFDAAFAAVVTALQAKGLLERTLVVAMGEFGRTPKINANVGRDHFPRANWCLLAGASVQPGQLIGGTNKEGTAPDDGTDIKPDDLSATILNTLGIDRHKEYYTQTGRPVSLIPHGRIIDQLFTGSG